MPPEFCPNCDAEVPEGAAACPECGADETTGWSPAAHCDRLGVPDPDEKFDYGEFVKNEFGGGDPQGRRPKILWSLTALVLLAVVLRWLL
jgi:uncharacterized membrane protein YvbJ